jgi:hypothetical protein
MATIKCLGFLKIKKKIDSLASSVVFWILIIRNL